MVVYSGATYKKEIYPWNFAKNNAEFKRITQGLRAPGGTTDTKGALEEALKLMETRNKTIPTLIMVVTDGRSGTKTDVPAQELLKNSDTWVFAAATGDPRYADRQYFHRSAPILDSHSQSVLEMSSLKLLAILTASLCSRVAISPSTLRVEFCEKRKQSVGRQRRRRRQQLQQRPLPQQLPTRSLVRITVDHVVQS